MACFVYLEEVTAMRDFMLSGSGKAAMNFMARPMERVIEERRKEAKAEKLRNIVDRLIFT